MKQDWVALMSQPYHIELRLIEVEVNLCGISGINELIFFPCENWPPLNV